MKTTLFLILFALNLINAACYKDIINYATEKEASGFGYILKADIISNSYNLYNSKGKWLSNAGFSGSAGRYVAEEIRFLSPKYVLVTYIYYSITGGHNIDVNPISRGQALFTIQNKKDLKLYLDEFKFVAASQNGRFIAYNKLDIKRSSNEEIRTNNLIILNTQTEKETILNKVPFDLSSIEDISNDGKNVVYINEDEENEELQYIEVYNTETQSVTLKKQVSTPLTLSESTERVGSSKTPYFKYFLVRFTPDGKSLLVGGYFGKEIKLLDLKTGTISKYKIPE
jgi:WD40 repeat protein